jgi:hypothetical protein
MITTFDETYQLVLQHKVYTVFGSKPSPYPSLRDNTGLSEKKPGRVTGVAPLKGQAF